MYTRDLDICFYNVNELCVYKELSRFYHSHERRASSGQQVTYFCRFSIRNHECSEMQGNVKRSFLTN